MATLEQRLQDAEYKFWMKGGLCLAFVKQGLESFADERSQKLHNYVKSALSNNCAAFHNMCGHASVSFDKNIMKWTLSCCRDCDEYTDVLVRLQSSPFKLKQSNWKNTNVQLWPHDHWNMAKIYMNEGQKASQTTSKDTDLIGILNFLENCSIPKVDIQNAKHLSEVRKARNRIFHSAAMKMTQADFDASTKAMIALLEDPFFLCREKDAKDAVAAIKEIQQSDFEISKMHEFQVLTDKIEAMRNQHDVLHGEVDTIKSDIIGEKNKLTTLQENQENIQIAVNALQNELQQKEDQIKELFIELAFLKKIVNDDSHLSEQIDIRVTAVETSLGRTDIEIRDIKLTFKGLQHQIAEIKTNIAAGEALTYNNAGDTQFKVRYLTERNEELQNQVKELKSQLQKYSVSMKVKKSVNEMHQRKIKDLEFEIEQLRKERGKKFLFKNKNGKDEDSQVQPSSMTFSPVVEQGVMISQDELKHQKERNQILQYEIDNLRGKIHDLESQSKHQEREKEIQNMKSRNCMLEAKLECSESKEKLLQKEVSEAIAKRDIEKEKIRAIEYQLDNFIASSKHAERERKAEEKQYKQTISGLKIQIQFLEDDNEDAEGLLKEAKKNNIDLRAKLCQSMNQLGEKDIFIKTLNTTHDAERLHLQRMINETKLQLGTETEQRKSSEGQLQRAQNEIDKLVTDRKHDTQIFQQALSKMKENVVSLEKICKQKDETLNQARNAERLLKLELENISEDYKRQTAELKAFRESNESCKLDLDRYCTEVKTLSDVVDSLTYKLKNEESKNESLKKQTELYELEIKQRKTDQTMSLALENAGGADLNDTHDEWHTPEEEMTSGIPVFVSNNARAKQKVHFGSSSFSDGLQIHDIEDTEFDSTADDLDVKDASEVRFKEDTTLSKRHKGRMKDKMDATQESEGFLNMRVRSRNQVDVSLSEDRTCPWVSGCVFLPNGNLVFCDFRNNKMKMLNRDLKMHSSLSLHAQPWDISVANSNEVVVTLLNSQQLQFVQVVPQLEKTRSIKLAMMCWGVEVVKDEIFVTCLDNSGEGSVRVLDTEGISKRQIVMQNGTEDLMQWEGPYNLTVSPTSGSIFVSDYLTNAVTRMDANGKVLFQYYDRLLNGPRDIVVDSDDNILICSARAYNLQIVDAEGVRHRTLSSSKGSLMKPWSLSYRDADNTLVVGCQGKHLSVIELEHSRRRKESTEDRI